MANILVSGLLNTETTAPVRGFPIPYYPIDYTFFGVNTSVSGVAFNIAKALHTLGDHVKLASLLGKDFSAAYIRQTMAESALSDAHVLPLLQQTPSSVVLYDPQGQRQIYCDLKDIQDTAYPFAPEILEDVDLVAACNINFNRPLLHLAQQAGKPIATDVHLLSDLHDPYNQEFLACATILFLSDEAIEGDHRAFLAQLAAVYPSQIIVLGRGKLGASLYQRSTGQIQDFPAYQAGSVANTVGAGDALFSAFLHFYSKGLSPAEALARAQIFAAHKITVSGASNGFVPEETVESFYQALPVMQAQFV